MASGLRKKRKHEGQGKKKNFFEGGEGKGVDFTDRKSLYK